jgi:hypothetical protein
MRKIADLVTLQKISMELRPNYPVKRDNPESK